MEAVTRYARLFREGARVMPATADRMKAIRARHRALGLREIRLLVPDVRSAAFRAEVARQVASLDPRAEAEALEWIEQVSCVQ